MFHPFLGDESVAMYGVEAGGHGVETGEHAAPLSAGVHCTGVRAAPVGPVTSYHAAPSGVSER